MRKIWSCSTRVGGCLALAVVWGLLALPESAFAAPPRCGDGVCRGRESFAKCPEDCPLEEDPSNPPFVQTHEGAVGHPLDCLACFEGDKPSCDDAKIQGDFFDVGTKHVGGESVCELLQCAVYMGGTVACGHNSDLSDEPRPRVNISGIFHLWEDDPRRQGDPTECFGNGILDPNVQVQAGSAGEFNVVLFFRDEVDGTLPGRCTGATKLVSYEARIGPCFSDEELPPGLGESTVITCYANTEASIRNQGGGGTGSKCACRASGLLNVDTVIRFRGL